MELRCFICDSDNKVKISKKDNKPVCTTCNAIVYAMLPFGKGGDLKADLAELEARLPKLFIGAMCPGDCECNCTYESGCSLLTKPAQHDTVESRGNKH